MDTAKYTELFVTESREKLSEISNGLLQLERAESPVAIAELFRAVHTIKGMAGAMGFAGVAELSHEMETLLDRLRSGVLTANPAVIETLFAAADALSEGIELAVTDPDRPADNVHLVAQLRQHTEEAPQTFTAEFEVLTSVPAASTERAVRHVRIDSRRLDRLMNLIGELVIVRGRLTDVAARLGDEALEDTTVDATKLIASIQAEIVTSRMVPVWQVFDRFPRLVRDTARNLGKDVDFSIEGKDIEVDRALLEEIAEPVMHALRNALDHGLESPDERTAAGKPAVGKLTLSAERDRATVVIRVEDDGRGIDGSLVLNRARELGLIDAGITSLTDDEVIRMISRPGFSTALRVSDISGRGVGIDIVDSKVRSLGGTHDLKSVRGSGTVVSIRLPLTLAIIRALIARLDNDLYAIPLTHVVETFQLREEMLAGSRDGMMLVREERVPTIRLRERFGMRGESRTPEQVVLVDHAERRAGLIVDEFLGQQEIVVKQFDPVRDAPQYFSGATIMSDGSPILILDTASVI